MKTHVHTEGLEELEELEEELEELEEERILFCRRTVQTYNRAREQVRQNNISGQTCHSFQA